MYIRHLCLMGKMVTKVTEITTSQCHMGNKVTKDAERIFLKCKELYTTCNCMQYCTELHKLVPYGECGYKGCTRQVAGGTDFVIKSQEFTKMKFSHSCWTGTFVKGTQCHWVTIGAAKIILGRSRWLVFQFGEIIHQSATMVGVTGFGQSCPCICSARLTNHQVTSSN